MLIDLLLKKQCNTANAIAHAAMLMMLKITFEPISFHLASSDEMSNAVAHNLPCAKHVRKR